MTRVTACLLKSPSDCGVIGVTQVFSRRRQQAGSVGNPEERSTRHLSKCGVSLDYLANHLDDRFHVSALQLAGNSSR